MKAIIGEPPIRSLDQFHTQVAERMSFPHYYGRNLDALWEVMRDNVERPSELVWLNSRQSSDAMRGEFAQIVSLFRELAAEDKNNGLAPFELSLK